MAEKTVAPTNAFWQDFSDNIPPVSQEMLREYEALRLTFERAREEMKCVEREIEELLILGASLEPGRLTVTLEPSGRLALAREEEPQSVIAPPFIAPPARRRRAQP